MLIKLNEIKSKLNLSKTIPVSSIVISSALKTIDAPSRVDKFPQDGIHPSAATPSVTGTTMRNSILSSQSDLEEGSRIKRDGFSDMTSFFHATVKG